jgi:hypothetical protein
MDLKETGCGVVDWISLVWCGDQWWALVNTVMNIRVRQNDVNFLCNLRRTQLLEVS